MEIMLICTWFQHVKKGLNMKAIKLTALLSVFLACCTLSAAKDDLYKNFSNKVWTEDFDSAVENSKVLKKPVLAVLVCSEPCIWCDKYTKLIFSNKNFINYAKANLLCVLIMIDSKEDKSFTFSSKNFGRRLSEVKKKYEMKQHPAILIIAPDDGEEKSERIKTPDLDEFFKRINAFKKKYF